MLHPRRYRRFRDLRPDLEAPAPAPAPRAHWRRAVHRLRARYREILRAEIAHTVSSQEEIAAETDRLIEEFSDEYAQIGVFHHVLVTLPWHLAFKHGKVQHSKLVAALAHLPEQEKRQ